VRHAAGETTEHFQFLRLPNLRGEAFRFADVLDDRHHSSNRTVGIVERRRVHVDGNERRIGALACGFQSTNDFSGQGPSQKRSMFSEEFGRNGGIGVADGLLNGETEDLFCSGVPGSDDTLQVDTVDSEGRSVHERSKFLVAGAGGGFASSANKGENLRYSNNQNDGGASGGQGGNNFNKSGKPVDGLPDCEDFHEMGGTATDNKDAKRPEKALVGEVGTSASHKKGEGTRNDDIRNADEEVSDNICPDKTRVAHVTIPMRKKIRGKNKARKKPQ